MVSHYSRESSNQGGTHPEWYSKIQSTLELLKGDDSHDESHVVAPKRAARAKTASKAKAKNQPKAKAKSKAAPKTDVLTAVAAAAHVSASPLPTNEPPCKQRRTTQSGQPILERSTAAPPSMCVQIPDSRFDIWGDTNTESEPDEEPPCQVDPGATPLGCTPPDRETPQQTDTPSLLPDSDFLQTAPSTPSLLASTAANEPEVPMSFPKPSDIATGFSNRKGAWIRFLSHEIPKIKYWTVTLEERQGLVWGVWIFEIRIVRAVIDGLQPSELGAALQTICSKYVKGQKQGCVRRPAVSKGFWRGAHQCILLQNVAHPECSCFYIHGLD